jgi:hypothetical protein
MGATLQTQSSPSKAATEDLRLITREDQVSNTFRARILANGTEYEVRPFGMRKWLVHPDQFRKNELVIFPTLGVLDAAQF